MKLTRWKFWYLTPSIEYWFNGEVTTPGAEVTDAEYGVELAGVAKHGRHTEGAELTSASRSSVVLVRARETVHVAPVLQ